MSNSANDKGPFDHGMRLGYSSQDNMKITSDLPQRSLLRNRNSSR